MRWSADGAWDSRAGTDGRRASAEDVSLASLSKELVHARMSEANMQRKLRVSAPCFTMYPPMAPIGTRIVDAVLRRALYVTRMKSYTMHQTVA